MTAATASASPGAPTTPRPPALQRLGAACGRHPLVVIGVWVVVLIVTVVTARAAGGIYSDSVNLSGTESSTGLALLKAGGDFADGVIAYEGSWLGAEAFVSFDRQAVELLAANGRAARLLG